MHALSHTEAGTSTDTRSVSLFSKTSGQSVRTVGGHGVLKGEEGKKGGHLSTTVSLPQPYTHTGTHFAGSQRTFGASYLGLKLLRGLFQSIIRLSRKQEILKTPDVSIRPNPECRI